jgi:hypothetical protein
MNTPLRTDPIDNVAQRAFVFPAADEKSFAAEVIDDGLLATQLAVLAISSAPIPWRPLPPGRIRRSILVDQLAAKIIFSEQHVLGRHILSDLKRQHQARSSWIVTRYLINEARAVVAFLERKGDAADKVGRYDFTSRLARNYSRRDFFFRDRRSEIIFNLFLRKQRKSRFGKLFIVSAMLADRFLFFYYFKKFLAVRKALQKEPVVHLTFTATE